MVLFEIIGQYEVLDIFKCLSRKQLVRFAISARCFAQLSESAAIHSVHLVDNFGDAVKLAGSNKEEDKEMFLALQNALQYEETRKHYRIVHKFYEWKRADNPHPDQLPFIRQCFPLMSAGLIVVTENYKTEEGWHLEVASKLDFFQGACTDVIFDWGFFGQHWHQMLTHPTVLAARSLAILNSTEIPNMEDLVNWLWHRQTPADDGNAVNECSLAGDGVRDLTFRLLEVNELVENIAGMLRQNSAMPLPNFVLRFTYDDCGNHPLRQFSIEPIQKMVDNGKNLVAKFEFINCPVYESSHPPVTHSWELRQFYGQIEKEEEIKQQKKRQKTGAPVVLLLNYNEEKWQMDSSDSDLGEEEEENMEEEIEDEGNQEQQ